MKYFLIKRGSLFILLSCLSWLTACTGIQSNAPEGNARTPVTIVKDPSGASPESDPAKSRFPPVRAGLAAAEFELLDGTKTKISDKKGKVLLVNIWGIWCGPCRAEMPHLVELQEKHRGDGLEVIGLNIGDSEGADEDVAAIKKFAGEMKLNYTIARSDDAATRQFYLLTKQSVVPQTILVDRDGNLRGVFIGGGPRVFNSMKESVAKTLTEQPA